MKKLILFFSVLFVLKANASHILGSEINYLSLGNNNYEVHLILYWDCTTGFNPGSSQSLSVDGCLGSQFVTLNQSTSTPGDGIDVTPLCPGSLSTCNGGSTEGVNKIEYVGVVTLLGACADWVFSWSTCCRGGNIINLSGGQTAGIYTYASLNNVITAQNNSPVINSNGVPYVCVNQPATIGFNAYDLDGHTLQYALVSAQDASGSPLAYNAPYTGTQPIQGITIDPNTGQINFTSTTQGAFIIVVETKEYDNNGNLIGIIMRDFTVKVLNCNNQTIGNGGGALTAGNVSGNGATLNPNDPFEIQTCAGVSFSFTVNYTDPNTSDSLFVSTNVASNPALAGATVVTSYPTPGQPNIIQMTFSWTAPSGNTNPNNYLSVNVYDNACPVSGQQMVSYHFDITPSAFAGNDVSICTGSNTILNANGPGTTYTWYDLSGSPIPVGPEFSCNPCQMPNVAPTTTSTYVLQTSGGAECVNSDTITITVAPDFNWTLTPGSTASGCISNPIQLGISPTQSGSYNYLWTPANGLNQTTIANPTAAFALPGTLTYYITISSAAGCSKQDSIIVTAQQGPPALSLADNICMNASTPIQMDIGYNCSTPVSCATTNLCNGSPSMDYQIGTGNFNPNQLPTPLLGWWHDGKTQLLFLASELQAQGMTQGLINRISWEVISIGSTQPYANFNISMGCTNSSVLNTNFQTGLSTVYSTSSYVPTIGLNTFTLPTPYVWDGISNIVIEICFDNTSYTQYDYVACSSTPFVSCAIMYTDGAAGCQFTTASQTYSSRANIKFNQTSSTNGSNFIYSWQPATGVSNPTISNPYITPPIGTTTYTVMVTTSDSSCSRLDSITFNVDPNNPQITSQPVGNTVCLWGTINLSCAVAGSGYSLQWHGNNTVLSNGANISGATSANLTITGAQAANEGWYWCEVIGSCSLYQLTDSVYIDVSGCVSIKENNNVSKLNVYPNPATDLLRVDLDNRNFKSGMLLVYNSLGQCVLQMNVDQKNKINLSTKDLAVGVYNLVLKSEQGIISQKFIKE